jgi:hypothetical protein
MLPRIARIAYRRSFDPIALHRSVAVDGAGNLELKR